MQWNSKNEIIAIKFDKFKSREFINNASDYKFPELRRHFVINVQKIKKIFDGLKSCIGFETRYLLLLSW